LRRIAQEIIVDQIQQISLMRLAVGEPLPPSVSSPTDPLPQPLAGRGSAVMSRRVPLTPGENWGLHL
jgi:hypothetical protein